MDRVLHSSPIGIAIIDLDGHYVDLNAAYAATYGYSVQALKPHKFTVVFSPERRDYILARHQDFLLRGVDLKGEWEVVRSDGSRLTIVSESVRLEGDDGRPQRLVYVLDISQRLRAEQALRQSEQKLAVMIECTMDAVISLDGEHRIILFNPAAEKMFGYAAAAMLGQPLDVLLPVASRGAHAQHIRAFAATGQTHRRMGQLGQLQALRANGEQFPIEASISQGQLADETIFTVILRDVTDQVRTRAQLEAANGQLARANAQLQELSQIDHLTQLPNRLLLFDRLRLGLSQCQRRGTHICVAYIDLDGFKAVNDNHGHQAGDALLVELSSRLRSQLREGDTLARIGGDEFIALLIDVESLDHCLPTIERLLHTASQPVEFCGVRLAVSVSIGVALSHKHSDGDLLVRQADAAMYVAKRSGKSRYALA